MNGQNWKTIWSGRSANPDMIQSGDPEKIFLELARSDGYDVVQGQISYESFLERHNEIKNKLSARLADGQTIQSVFEVGCGSGANLFLMEQDGIACGGIDYSSGLIESAKRVLRSEDLHCMEAAKLPVEKRYDASVSIGVFCYFADEQYASEVLERMYQKARYAVGVVDIMDAGKRESYLEHRRAIIPNYEERYQGLHRMFYTREFFQQFAESHGMDIEITPSGLRGYWNDPFIFNCYLYKRQRDEDGTL